MGDLDIQKIGGRVAAMVKKNPKLWLALGGVAVVGGGIALMSRSEEAETSEAEGYTEAPYNPYEAFGGGSSESGGDYGGYGGGSGGVGSSGGTTTTTPYLGEPDFLDLPLDEPLINVRAAQPIVKSPVESAIDILNNTPTFMYNPSTNYTDRQIMAMADWATVENDTLSRGINAGTSITNNKELAENDLIMVTTPGKVVNGQWQAGNVGFLPRADYSPAPVVPFEKAQADNRGAFSTMYDSTGKEVTVFSSAVDAMKKQGYTVIPTNKVSSPTPAATPQKTSIGPSASGGGMTNITTGSKQTSTTSTQAPKASAPAPSPTYSSSVKTKTGNNGAAVPVSSAYRIL